MVPISELNEIRRRAVSLLNNIRLKKFNAPNVSVSCKSYFMDNNKITKKYLSDGLIVAVEDLKALEIAVDAGANAILFGGDSYHHNLITAEMYHKAIEIAHTKNCKLFISTPRIVRQNEQTEFAIILEASHDADAIYVHNVATLHLAKKISSVPIHTDYSLISFNSETLNLLYNLDVVSVTLSPELTLEQIKTLAKSATIQLECIVHGRLELMISQYCAIGSFLGGVGEHKCKEPCKRQKFYLRDRKKTCFPIVTDQFCRMHVLNSKVLSMLPYVHDLKNAGIGAFRIDGRYLSNDELVQTVQVYRRAFNGDSLNETNISENLDFTRGHYFRGVIS